MNQTRRNDIRAAERRLDALKPQFSILDTIKAELANVKDELERLRDEEQDYLDNMPESLQSSEKADTAGEAISSLDEAISEIESLVEAFPEADALDMITDLTDAAKGTE